MARAFAPLVPAGTRILVDGGNCKAETEWQYSAPWVFYWMDQKGFSVCAEDLSVERVEAFQARGAHYLVWEGATRHARPGFEEAMRRRFPVVASTPDGELFKLDPGT